MRVGTRSASRLPTSAALSAVGSRPVRSRQHTAMSWATGQVVRFTVPFDETVTVAERLAGIKEKAAEALGRDPAAMTGLAVSCDGCPEGVRLEDNARELPPGWDSNATGEFCPDCRGRAN